MENNGNQNEINLIFFILIGLRITLIIFKCSRKNYINVTINEIEIFYAIVIAMTYDIMIKLL